MQVIPYLSFNGDCEEAFKFYQQCTGGTIEAMMSHEGTPAEEHVPAEWRSKIMHARLNIDGGILMGGDAPPPHQVKPDGFCVSLQIGDPVEGKRVFNALAENGKVTMPFEKTFWADGFGMLIDRFGIPWMINCESAA